MAEGRLLDNWLKAYLAYTAESMSPEDYHVWMGVSSIAAVLQRRVFYSYAYFTLYPNLFIVLVGPPGRCKKSTAMRMGREISGAVPNVNFSVDSTTRERLIQDMSQSYKDGMSSLTAHSTEFATFLTSSGMDMVNFLTDIFDCPSEWTHKTKGGGTNKIKAPYLNLVGATTPDWIAQGMPLDTIGVGFTSRVIFVFQDTPRIKDPFAVLSPEQLALKDLLIQDLAHIANALSGQYDFNPEAKEMYRHWDMAHQAKPNPTGDPRLSGYFERKPEHLRKLCMIMAASKRDELIITEEDFTDALRLLQRTESRMPEVFASLGRNPLYADQESAFVAFVSNPEGFTKGELLDRFGYNVRKEEMEEILETLIARNKVALRGSKYYAIKGAGNEGAGTTSG
jgi:hypothetical protein